MAVLRPHLALTVTDVGEDFQWSRFAIDLIGVPLESF
jgi:hypothetical protein